MSDRLALILAGVLGLTAVAAGAFGAHAIQGRIDEDLLEAFEIGARYHMYHALALLGATAARRTASPTDPPRRWGRWWTAAAWCFVAGTAVFSGTLYALALTGQRWLGAVTPVGGVLLLAGWACIAGGAAMNGRQSAAT